MNDLRVSSPWTFRRSPVLQDFTIAWSVKLLVVAALVVVVCTLYPFKFTFTGASPLVAIAQNFRSRSSLLDVLANIILFAPLGFGLGGVWLKRQAPVVAKLAAIALVSGGFSLVIEIFQVFLPGRRPTPLDVVSNTLGGVVGFLLFLAIGSAFYALLHRVFQTLQTLLRRISLKYLLVTLGIYLALASALVISWQGASLRGWYNGFPLSIGNDYSFYHHRLQREISMAWTGTVADVVLRDRALSKTAIEELLTTPDQATLPTDESVIMAYSLRGNTGNQDATGRSPDLVWQGKPQPARPQGTAIANDHWLQTSTPMDAITQRLRQTSQFTLSAVITAAEPNSPFIVSQPIVAIARPDGRGNIALTQAGSNLNVLLGIQRVSHRSSVNTQSVPNVFVDARPHHIVVSYAGFVARVYVDSADRGYLFDLTPNRFQIVLYLLLLFPLAVLITLVAQRVQRHVGLYILVIAGGTVLPALLLESILANEGDRNIRLANLLIGMITVGGTILMGITGRSPRQLKLSS